MFFDQNWIDLDPAHSLSASNSLRVLERFETLRTLMHDLFDQALRPGMGTSLYRGFPRLLRAFRDDYLDEPWLGDLANGFLRAISLAQDRA